MFTLCSNTFQPNKELIVRDFEFRERMFTSITDLITLAIFLGISPQVKEGMTAYIRGDDKKDMTAFRNFLKQTANIQRDACVWMLESVLKTYKPDLQVSLVAHWSNFFDLFDLDPKPIFSQKTVHEIDLD